MITGAQEDLVFPLFLLIVGAVVPYAVLGRVEKGARKRSIYARVFKRAFILVFWGLVAYGLLRFGPGTTLSPSAQFSI